MECNASRKSSLPESRLSIKLQPWSTLYQKSLAKRFPIYIKPCSIKTKPKASLDSVIKKRARDNRYYQKLKADPERYQEYLRRRQLNRLSKKLNLNK